MKILSSLTILVALLFATAAPLFAQQPELPQPGPEYDVFRMEVGTWDVEITTWPNPGEPKIVKGKETSRLVSGFWLVTNFRGGMVDLNNEYEGHGIYGYDAARKRYVGTWVESMNPQKMEMVGTYDKASQTMTYVAMVPGPDLKLAKHIIVTKYKNDGTRVVTMHIQSGKKIKPIFEMNYTKAKDE